MRMGYKCQSATAVSHRIFIYFSKVDDTRVQANNGAANRTLVFNSSFPPV